jgi:hypothetical protein
MEPVTQALLSDLFLELFDAAQFDACGAMRFARGHACAKVFVREHRKVRVNFLIEV